MKVSCQRDELRTALGIVNRAIKGQLALPILGDVLIATDQGRLRLAATNLELGIVKWIGAKIDQEGAIVLPAKLLTAAVANSPADLVELEADSKSLTLRSGDTKTKLSGLEAQDFPVIPLGEGEPTATISAEELRKAVTQGGFAASDDETRPALMSAYVRLCGQEAVFVTADGFRLAVRKARLLFGPAEPITLLIPAVNFAELRHLADQEAVDLVFTPSWNRIVFRSSTGAVSSSLLSATYPNWEVLIPKTFTTKFSAETASFAKALRACGIFVAGGKNGLYNRVSLRAATEDERGRLRLSSRNEETGRIDYDLDVDLDGEPNKIAFDGRYLRAGVSVVDTDRISFCFNGPSSPALIQAVGDEDFTYVAMPLFLNWDEEGEE